MASWRLLWILIVRNCSVCSVLCLCLGSRLSPWRGFLPRLPLTLLPGVALLRLRRHRPLRAFHLQFSLRCAGLNSAHVLPNTRLVLNMFAVISMFFRPFSLCFPIGLLHRSSIQSIRLPFGAGNGSSHVTLFPHLSGEGCLVLCQLAASSSFSSSAGPQLQARDRSGPCRARKPRIRVTGPQLQARDRSGPCRTRAASPGSE